MEAIVNVVIQCSVASIDEEQGKFDNIYSRIYFDSGANKEKSMARFYKNTETIYNGGNSGAHVRWSICLSANPPTDDWTLAVPSRTPFR